MLILYVSECLFRQMTTGDQLKIILLLILFGLMSMYRCDHLMAEFIQIISFIIGDNRLFAMKDF